jgi:hypothetical protein
MKNKAVSDTADYAPCKVVKQALNKHRVGSACLQAWFRQDGVSGSPFRTTTYVKSLNTL